MATGYTDKVLTCADCGAEFTFSVGEQERFAELGFTNEPKRCPPCRAAKKASGGGSRGGGGNRADRNMGGPKELHEVTCADCGRPARVPFKPRGDRPVYCSDCFGKRGR